MPEYSYYVIAAFGIVFFTLSVYAWQAVSQYIKKTNQ